MTDLNYNKVLVFGGTTEGRLIADKLNKKNRLLCVCVATEYGETFLEDTSKVRVGRLDMLQMVDLFKEIHPTLVIDATHPYAVDVTKNIKEACDTTKIRCVRVNRKNEILDDENMFKSDSLSEIIRWLNEQNGIIFSTLGVKEVHELRNISDFDKRVYVRVLPVESSLKACEEAGLDRSHVIDAMGPFSYEQNIEMIRDISADILITKESGKVGGFSEKIKAAIDSNLKIAILTRPEEDIATESYNIDEILDSIEKVK